MTKPSTERHVATPAGARGENETLLLPCPFCGDQPEFGEVTDMDHPDFGGHFIACKCLACLGLKYAEKVDPRPLLAEQWNTRFKPAPSALADDEDERGFTPSDYAHTTELLRSSEPIRKAAASNNHNIILAALDLCAELRSASPVRGEGIGMSDIQKPTDQTSDINCLSGRDVTISDLLAALRLIETWILFGARRPPHRELSGDPNYGWRIEQTSFDEVDCQQLLPAPAKSGKCRWPKCHCPKKTAGPQP